jgi:hypothetical protein
VARWRPAPAAIKVRALVVQAVAVAPVLADVAAVQAVVAAAVRGAIAAAGSGPAAVVAGPGAKARRAIRKAGPSPNPFRPKRYRARRHLRPRRSPTRPDAPKPPESDSK